MNISISLLLSKLENIYQFTYEGHYSNLLNLERPLFYNKNNKILENHIYISVNFMPLEKIPSSSILFYIGDLLNNNQQFENIVFLDNEHCCFELFNNIQKIFNLFDSWDKELQSIVNSNGAIQDIVDCSYDIFKNPILIHTSDFAILAFYESLLGDCQLYNLCNPKILFDSINMFKLDDDYNKDRKSVV